MNDNLDLEPYREQGVPYQCPHCFEDISPEHIVGKGDYPIYPVRIGHNIGGKAVLMECPNCFEKSFCHESCKQIPK